MPRSRLLLPVLAAASVLTPLAPAHAQTATDTSPPQLVSFDVSPRTVDVTSSPAAVTATACVKDETGVGEVTVGLQQRSTAVQGTALRATATAPSSGTRSDGCFTVRIPVPLAFGPVVLVPQVLPLTDTLGNAAALVLRSEPVTVVTGALVPGPHVIPVLEAGAPAVAGTVGAPVTLRVTGTPDGYATLYESLPDGLGTTPVRSFRFDARGRASLTYTPTVTGRSLVWVRQVHVPVNSRGTIGSLFSNNLAVNAVAATAGTPATPGTPGAPSGPGSPLPPSPPTPTPPQVPTSPQPAGPVALGATPRAVDVGRASLVSVTGPAGAAVELYAYTRPSTTYRIVRRGTLDATGRAAWNVTPGGNTRLYARVAGRSSASTTVDVRHAVSIAVARNGGTYRFSGAVRPGFSGLPVTLLRTLPGGGATVVAVTRTTARGTWVVDRRFTGSGTFGFYAVTGASSSNVAGRSSTVRTAVSPPPRR